MYCEWRSLARAAAFLLNQPLNSTQTTEHPYSLFSSPLHPSAVPSLTSHYQQCWSNTQLLTLQFVFESWDMVQGSVYCLLDQHTPQHCCSWWGVESGVNSNSGRRCLHHNTCTALYIHHYPVSLYCTAFSNNMNIQT